MTRKKVILTLIVIILFALIVYLLYRLAIPVDKVEPEQISYAQFLEYNENGKVEAVLYRSSGGKLYGMFVSSPFPVERIHETYDFWVEDVPSEEQLWQDMETVFSAAEGDYGFLMRLAPQ